jgi:hypothetical protein
MSYYDQSTQPQLPPSNGGAVPLAAHPAYAPAYPAEAFHAVPVTPPRRSAGFWVAVTVGAAVAVIAVLLSGFFIGRSTRLSNAEVQSRIVQQQQADEISQQQALNEQKAADQAVMNKAVVAAQKSGQQQGLSQGKIEGQQQGFAQGQKQGYQQGQAAGQAQGYQQGQSTGYNQGQSAGYSQGFNSGLCASANLVC